MNTNRVEFSCGNITLEGVWHLPEDNGLFPAVVVCHPHSLYGGNMMNNVVTAICEKLAKKSVAAFRFNFRGVGRSGGDFSNGIGEQEDVKAALDFISSASNIDADKIGLAGYSFGGSVALPVAFQDKRVSFLALISPALSNEGWQRLKAYHEPVFIIAGDADSIIGFDKFQQNIKELQQGTHFQVIPGADHFWLGNEDKVSLMVSQYFANKFSGINSKDS